MAFNPEVVNPRRHLTDAIYEANLGPRHTSVDETLNNMTGVFKAHGKLDKAIETCEQALEITKANLGPRHTSVADMLNNMACVFKAQGELDKALETYEQALEIYDAHEQSREDAKEVRAALASLKRRRGVAA
jgi:tetratricopeptide (TPR) repeat protein